MVCNELFIVINTHQFLKFCKMWAFVWEVLWFEDTKHLFVVTRALNEKMFVFQIPP